MLFAWLSTQVTQETKATGLIVHRRKRVKYLSLFGAVEIESPYLWNKETGLGVRPVKEQLGIEHGEPSRASPLGASLGCSATSFG